MQPSFPPELMRLSYNSTYRACVIADLQELSAFLAQRLATLHSTTGLVNPTLPDSILHHGTAAIESMLADVSTAIAALTSPTLRQLFLISTSQKFVLRLIRDLNAKAAQVRHSRTVVVSISFLPIYQSVNPEYYIFSGNVCIASRRAVSTDGCGTLATSGIA